MISRWNFTQWPSHLSGARGGLLLFLPKLSDFSFANCSRAMFHKSTDYGNDMMVVQFLICFSLSCMHDFPRNFSKTVNVIVKKQINNNFPWTVLLPMTNAQNANGAARGFTAMFGRI